MCLFKFGFVTFSVLYFSGLHALAAVLLALVIMICLALWLLELLFGWRFKGPPPEEQRLLDVLFYIAATVNIVNLAIVAITAPTTELRISGGGLRGIGFFWDRNEPVQKKKTKTEKDAQREEVEEMLRNMRDPKGTQDAVNNQVSALSTTLREPRDSILSTPSGELTDKYTRVARPDTPMPRGPLFPPSPETSRLTPADYIVLTSSAIRVQRSEHLSDIEIEMVAEIFAKISNSDLTGSRKSGIRPRFGARSSSSEEEE